MSKELEIVAARAIELAKKQGAQGVAAVAERSRDVSLEWRDGKVESVKEATTQGLSIELYVDGRYGSMATSDLRPEALETFVADAVALTRAIAKDPYRELPDAKLYDGRAELDLELEDPKHAAVGPDRRKEVVKEAEAAAKGVEGNDAIISVQSSFYDTRAESVRLTSNGFRGSRVETYFGTGVDVSVKDPDGRKPEEGHYVGGRHVGELPSAAEVGRIAASRALSKIGAKKPESAELPMAVENRVARRLVGQLFGPMSAWAIQQKRSFLEGKIGSVLGSKLLTVSDDPLVKRGLGSRLYDDEGIAARPRPLFTEGKLETFFVDTYYGKKLGIAPTTGGSSNLSWKLGSKSQDDLLAEMKEGILVTSFLGGNSNSTTGDFSLGVEGFRIRGGKRAEPVSELNISANQTELWKRLIAVGNDPYPYSPSRTPTLVFDGITFAGL